MYYKVKFLQNIDEDLLSDLEFVFDKLTGKEVIQYLGHNFVVERDGDGNIIEVTFCNQCVRTFNIEETFLELISSLISATDTVCLFDSYGNEEEVSREELLEMF